MKKSESSDLFEPPKYKPFEGRPQSASFVVHGLHVDMKTGETRMAATYLNEEGEEEELLFLRCDLTPEGQAEFDRRLKRAGKLLYWIKPNRPETRGEDEEEEGRAVERTESHMGRVDADAQGGQSEG